MGGGTRGMRGGRAAGVTDARPLEHWPWRLGPCRSVLLPSGVRAVLDVSPDPPLTSLQPILVRCDLPPVAFPFLQGWCPCSCSCVLVLCAEPLQAVGTCMVTTMPEGGYSLRQTPNRYNAPPAPYNCLSPPPRTSERLEGTCNRTGADPHIHAALPTPRRLHHSVRAALPPAPRPCPCPSRRRRGAPPQHCFHPLHATRSRAIGSLPVPQLHQAVQHPPEQNVQHACPPRPPECVCAPILLRYSILISSPILPPRPSLISARPSSVST